MSATHHDEPAPSLLMGIPLSNGKLAIWLFLVTEIMFFTGLIGAYIVLRQSTPDRWLDPATGQFVATSAANEHAHQHIHWPRPHDVHLAEWMGAVNTFVLICSSLTVVLAHHALGKKQTAKATGFIAVTLALGSVFMVIKAFEYKAKFDHGILPGRIGDHLEHADVGFQYKDKVRAQLRPTIEKAARERDEAKGDATKLDALTHKYGDYETLFRDLDGTPLQGTTIGVPPLTPMQTGRRVNEIQEKLEPHGGKSGDAALAHVHLPPYIPYGNMWASCYFAMTGFHAIHVLGGLVIFVIMLLMAASGKFGPQHESLVELTGLYWHFVDVVWIFLFPLLYLV